MRGLRLFIRPIEPGDSGAIDAFLESTGKSTSRPVDRSTSTAALPASNRLSDAAGTPVPGATAASRPLVDSSTGRLVDSLVDSSTGRLVDWRVPGLVGKLLGDIVAVCLVEQERDVLQVRLLFVAETFRKKWIGRTMLRELDGLAKKLDKHSIVVARDDAAGAEEFLRRTGFHGEGERWVRVVS